MNLLKKEESPSENGTKSKQYTVDKYLGPQVRAGNYLGRKWSCHGTYFRAR